MMELGFVDFVISTGANLYHDLHRPFEYPVRQGGHFVGDAELHKLGIARIYDTYIEDSETLTATDRTILDLVKLIPLGKPISTAEFHHILGKHVLEKALHPEKSLLAQAAKLNVPIYTSSPGDSSIGLELANVAVFGKRVIIDPTMDVAETTAIVNGAHKNGVIVVGGGSPKNFYMQTQPMLQQFFRMNKEGHDYFIQLTTDAPHWGGLSGATPQEARSWGKIRGSKSNSAVVYSCASITFPLICQFVRQQCKARTPKELYLKRRDLVSRLIEDAKGIPINLEEFERNYGEGVGDADFY
jgi:deoxyhypusine synthase